MENSRLPPTSAHTMAIYELGDYTPNIDPTAWVADSASVIGRVAMGAGASVWFGAVLRGDNEWITLGKNANVQDGCVLHTDIGYPLTLGEGASVGHQVMLHGCTVGAGSLIGIGAIVLNGAKIGKNSVVGAGSLVTEGKEFPDNSLIMGSPARVVRTLEPEQIERFGRAATYYVSNAERYRNELRRLDLPAHSQRIR